MMNRLVCTVVLSVMLAGSGVGGLAQGVAAGASVGKRPMTFADLQRMKRVSDPQISSSGRWVMFSVTEVDLGPNAKVNHLWVVPLLEPIDSTKGTPIERVMAREAAQEKLKQRGRERQITFWKEGESGGRFSPDGKKVLFTATDSKTGLSQIFLAPWNESAGTLGTPVRLTNISSEADGAVWAPNSKRILFASRVYPECSEGSSWLEEDNCDRRKDDAAAANPVKAQVFDHLLYRHWNSYVGPKRSHVLVVSATDGNAVRDLTPRQDIGDAEAPTFSLGGPLGYAWAPGSEEIAYVTNLDLVPAASTNNDVFTLLLDDPGAKPRKISTSLGSDDGPAYSPDGKYIAFRSQARAGYESDRFRLMLFDRLAGTTKELLPKFDRWVDEFVWTPDSNSIFIASGDAGQTAVVKADVVGDGAGTFEVVSGYHELSDLQVSRDGGTLVTSEMSVAMPTEISATDLNSMENAQAVGLSPDEQKVYDDRRSFSISHTLPEKSSGHHREQITHLNDALLSTLDLAQLRTFKFAGAGGTAVQGFIIRPPNFDETRRYPVKFLIHGGPQGAWGDAWSYRWNAELMAASGYVVVMVNPRGSTGYGQAFVDGVNGDWGGKAYVDLMKGLDYAEQHYPFIDKTRECALGASYGGFMADWILTHTNRFACIVTHDGMFNPQSAYGTTEELWFNEWEFREPAATVVSKGHTVRQGGDSGPAQPWNYFDKPVAQDPFRKWSPMLSIKNAKTPTLVIHSQRDYRLDVSEGFQLFTALQRLNVPSKMLYFPDEGHWILKPQNSKLWYETVGEWCDLWTKTNAYATGTYEGMTAPVAPARVQAPDVRVGQSRPVEMDETQPLPQPAVAPPVAVAKTAPPRHGAAAPVVRAAPVAPPPAPPLPTPTAPPAPAVVTAPKTGSGGASFSIAISAPNDEVQVGSDARVLITLTNLTDRQILFAHRPGTNNPEFSYTITVRSAAGHVVEETAYGREARQRQQTENRTVDYLQPGQSSVQTAHIARLVSVTRPGRYTVRVSRTDPASHAVVESNEVTLNVVP
jgi:dipeptidyl aminopeptidase/acylaminoacyl peptidase